MPDLTLPEMTKDYYGAGGDLRLGPDDDDSTLRLIPVVLLRALVADAQQQLDGARAHGVLFGPRSRTTLGADDKGAGAARAAEAEWRRSNPGLARLLRLAAGEH